MTHAVTIYSKSKTITRVCYSSKDAETIYLVRLMEDAVFAARQLNCCSSMTIEDRSKYNYSQTQN